MDGSFDYGFWPLVAINSLIFMIFAFSFTKPRTGRGRRSLGAFSAFIVIMVGFLLQWPTILTVAMFPVLVWMYVRLARREEVEVRAEFGDEYDRCAAVTAAFIPGLGSSHRTAGPPASGGRV